MMGGCRCRTHTCYGSIPAARKAVCACDISVFWCCLAYFTFSSFVPLQNFPLSTLYPCYLWPARGAEQHSIKLSYETLCPLSAWPSEVPLPSSKCLCQSFCPSLLPRSSRPSLQLSYGSSSALHWPHPNHSAAAHQRQQCLGSFPPYTHALPLFCHPSYPPATLIHFVALFVMPHRSPRQKICRHCHRFISSWRSQLS